MTGYGRTQTLRDTCSGSTWLSVWPKTGTIGKQVILLELMEQASPQHLPRCHEGAVLGGRSSARETLQGLLAIMDNQQNEGSSHDIKALLTNRVMCLAALMTCHAPVTDLLEVALRQIYHRLDNHELSNIAQKWRACPEQGRATVYYAARLFETVRNNQSAHYAMPIYLFRAVLTLWLYARLFDNENLTGFSVSSGSNTAATPSTKSPNDLDILQWLNSGSNRIQLPGIADLLNLQGRRELLFISVATMHSLKSWGVSRAYLNLLKRLASS